MHQSSTVDVPPIKKLSSIAAENNADQTAFGDGIEGRRVTWEEFDEESKRVANGLRKYVKQGDRVAFLCENSVKHTILWNGAQKAGCIGSNLHIRASPDTVTHCINAFRPRVLVVDESTSEFFEERIWNKVTTDFAAIVTTGESRTEYEQSIASLTDDVSAIEPDVRVRENDIVVVMWTSGTTGKPKGWCFTNRALYLRGSTLVDVLDINRSTQQPSVFTPSFAAWYSVLLPALISSASTYFHSEWDPEKYLYAIDENKMTTALLVPTMWREILNLESFDDYDTNSLKTVTSAGEVLDSNTLEALRSNICEVVKNSYAATEAYATVMMNDELKGDRIESVGKPVPGAQVRVVEESGSYEDVLPPGEVGELAVKAPDCPVWAWERSNKTEEVFEDGWWYSGDLGYRDEDGFLYLEGRSDFLIISRGIKVYPSPVEERLNEHPVVEESAVVGIEDEGYGERVTAYIYRSESDLTADELNKWCLGSDQLARYERPRKYHLIDEPLPRTATGKLDRNATRKRF